MAAIDLNRQQALDSHPKPIRQIDFMRNLHWDGNGTMIFIIKEAKNRYFLRNCESFVNYNINAKWFNITL